MTTAETRVLTAHVPTELAAKVDNLAERLDRSRGWVVKQALSAWVEQEELRYRMTQEALADVAAGRDVAHAEVEKWAQSLSTKKPKPLPACP